MKITMLKRSYTTRSKFQIDEIWEDTPVTVHVESMGPNNYWMRIGEDTFEFQYHPKFGVVLKKQCGVEIDDSEEENWG